MCHIVGIVRSQTFCRWKIFGGMKRYSGHGWASASSDPGTVVPPVASVPDNDPLDSWDVEDEPVLTPEDEEAEDAEDGDGENDVTPKQSKKKSQKIEESKSKKEHVNVVFIGHVGKLNLSLCHPQRNSPQNLSS